MIPQAYRHVLIFLGMMNIFIGLAGWVMSGIQGDTTGQGFATYLVCAGVFGVGFVVFTGKMEK